jgi:cholesterol transport system auxiliary component
MSRTSLILAAGLATLLLAGCGSIGGPKTEVRVFSPSAKVEADPAWPSADWQVTVGVQSANQLLDSTTIAVRPTPNVLQTYKGARWADTAPDLLQTAIVEGFEDSGKVGGVSRLGGNTRGDFGLFLEVRSFETIYAGGAPEAVVEVQARLVKFRGRAMASQRFRRAVPGAGADIDSMVAAFGQAMSQVSADVIGWTLVEGNRLAAVSEEESAER